MTNWRGVPHHVWSRASDSYAIARARRAACQPSHGGCAATLSRRERDLRNNNQILKERAAWLLELPPRRERRPSANADGARGIIHEGSDKNGTTSAYSEILCNISRWVDWVCNYFQENWWWKGFCGVAKWHIEQLKGA